MKQIKDYILESRTTYYVNFNGSGIMCYSVGEAIRTAKKNSLEYGSATIICEEIQIFNKFRIPTRVWTEVYENGKLVSHEDKETRYHSKKQEYIDVSDWENDWENAIK